MTHHDPVMIEVRANEFATQQHSPHVPYGASAMIADALASQAAGASGYHWHGRGTDGVDRPDDIALHSEVIRGLAASGMLLHPTLGFTSTQGDVEGRLRTVDALLAQGDRPDIVPVDVGAIVADRFDPEAGGMQYDDAVLLNRTGYLRDLLSAISDRGIAILLVVWSPGGVRTALRLREAGTIRVPVLWQLGFTGDLVPGGLPATEKQLDAFLDVIPADEPWNVHVRDGDGLPMAVAAMLRGGHVAIGLGDDPYERLGLPTNAQLVQRVADAAVTIGRPVATASEARAMLAANVTAS